MADGDVTEKTLGWYLGYGFVCLVAVCVVVAVVVGMIRFVEWAL